MSKSSKHVWRRHAALGLAALGGCASLASSAFATNYTWLGTGGNNNWNNNLNWVDQNGANVVPPLTPPAGDVTNLLFGGFAASATSTQNVGEIEVNALTFGGSFTGTATLNLSASSTGNQFIRLGAGGLVGNVAGSSGNAGTVAITGGTNRKLILTADQTWSNSNTFGIISQRRTMEGAFKITKSGPGTIEFQSGNAAWTGGLQIDEGFIRTSNFTDALGTGPITVNTSNNVGISASGTVQTDQVVAGAVTLGGSGTFSLIGSWNVGFNNTVTLLSDKNVAVSNIGTFNGAIDGAGFRLNKLGGGTMLLGAASNTHGGFDVRGGTVQFAADAQLGAGTGAVGLGSSTTAQGTLITGTLRVTAPITSTRNINLLDAPGGAVDTAGNDVTFGNVAGAGAFTKLGAGQLTVNHVRATDFAVRGGSVRIAAGATAGEPARVSVVNSLTLNDGAVPPNPTTLDLTNNGLVIDYTAASPLADVQAAVTAAYNNGAWDQPGLTSSSANNSTHGVGFGEASAIFAAFPASFMGQSVDNTSVLARYARYGDANLDAQVNLADFNRLAANFGATGATWTQGDFNYDGNVNLSDFNRLAGNFGLSAAGPQVTPDDWARLGAAVPEPASIALFGVAASAAMSRRHRRRAR